MSLTVDLTGTPTGDEDALSDSGSECGDIPQLGSVKEPTKFITGDCEESSSSDTESESEYETDSELFSDLDERYEANILIASQDVGKTVRSSRPSPTPKPDLTQVKVTKSADVQTKSGAD